MSAPSLAMITTRLPPAPCGVGGFSALLREHWPDPAASVEFFVMEPGGTGLHATDRETAFGGDGARLACELERLGAADLILHYAGRGYHRYGLPGWLPRVLRAWKQRFARARLLVIFHEVPGGGLPVTSVHYWLGKAETRIVRQLARLGDIVVTNTAWHRDRLREISARADIHLFPVGANIEAASGAPGPRTRTEFVLFGLPYGRWQTLRLFEPDLARWIARGDLTRLHIIGPRDGKFAAEADHLLALVQAGPAAVHHGALPAAEVSRLLHRAQFALTNATAQTWGKSTTFMACAAHRCAPVIRAAQSAPIPLSSAVLSDEVEGLPDAELARRADVLQSWYREHADWRVTAPRLAALLAGVSR
ncbi:MAG: hypothetical protein ACR2NX_13385 [Chthoniobacterales bacterium]